MKSRDAIQVLALAQLRCVGRDQGDDEAFALAQRALLVYSEVIEAGEPIASITATFDGLILLGYSKDAAYTAILRALNHALEATK